MKWNLRLAAANRGIWKASELQRMLADHGLTISAGKMSGLWSGAPASIKLADLDVICVVLGCDVGKLLVAEPDRLPAGPPNSTDIRRRVKQRNRSSPAFPSGYFRRSKPHSGRALDGYQGAFIDVYVTCYLGDRT